MNKLLVIVTLVVAALVGWHFLSSSDEARVREVFKEMSAELDKSGEEPPLESFGKARRAAALVEPGCTVEAFGKSVVLAKGLPEIARQVVSVRMMAAHLHVSFEDLSVVFSDDSTAEAACDFFYTGDDLGWSVRDARALDATLRKNPEDGRWRFSRVRLSNILEK